MVPFENKKIVLSVGGPKRIQIGPINHLPLALLSIAAWLRKNGNYPGKIQILDTHIDTAKLSYFSDAAIVGISAMTGMQIQYGLEI
ncbi:MAG: hypothetical protein D3910_07255, partial [Candidatus Electrothrix sp. ATG2]|nr:hypothetical protein [Candidatus Electrothrix sp. ATG2]